MPSNNEHTNRRDFLKTSSLAALGASALAATGGLAEGQAEGQASRTSGRPFVTGVKGKKLVGCYINANVILDEPKYMDALQQKLGVNAVIVFSRGIRMTDSLKALNPLNGKGWMGISPAKDNDDSQLVKAIDELHRRGMDAWLYYSGRFYGQLYRPICGETFEGVAFNDLPPIKYANEQRFTPACFNKPPVVEWELKAYTYGAQTYDVDAIYVTHFRYINSAYFTNLFGCACPDCQKLAGQMGYNFAAMKKACQNLQSNLKKLDKAKVQQAARVGYTLTDFMLFLADDRAVLDWLYFRAGAVGMRMKNIRDSIHKATNNRAQFISDTNNPTQALYVGHNYNDMMNGSSDGLMPLAWLDHQYISAVAALANLLVTWVPGLDEETAITVMLKFFGWDDLPIQRKSISDLHIGVDSKTHNDKEFYEYFNKGATLALMTHEMQHLAMLNTKGYPSFPVIKGHLWTEAISRELIDRCMAMGHTGYVFQETELFIDKTKL